MNTDTNLPDGASGRQGAIGHFLSSGNVEESWVMVWPDRRKAQFWVVLAPHGSTQVVRLLSIEELKSWADVSGVSWLAPGREESRLEASIFGIRPDMDPSSVTPDPARMDGLFSEETHTYGEGTRWLASPGARWIGFPLYSAIGLGALGGGIQFGVQGGRPWLALGFVVLGLIGCWFMVRALVVGLRVVDGVLRVRGWYRTKSFPSATIVGFASTAYDGGLNSAPWVWLERYLRSLKVVREVDAPLVLSEIFGTERQIRRIRGRLMASMSDDTRQSPDGVQSDRD